jgi:hypothetical protein
MQVFSAKFLVGLGLGSRLPGCLGCWVGKASLFNIKQSLCLVTQVPR